MATTPTFSIGIDLGTTNSVLAYARLGEEQPKVELLPIPQLVATATVEPRNLLPSFLYLGTDTDRDAKALDVPWAKKRDFAVGELARKQSADVPTRTGRGCVASRRSPTTATRRCSRWAGIRSCGSPRR